MRVPLAWLAEWIELPASEDELVEKLTVGGLEIEEVLRSGPDLSQIVVGYVIERRQHPDADRLSHCRVDIGTGTELSIVCGAPNVATGQKVAVVQAGISLPDGTKIKRSKIRGVESQGMICSTRELGLGEEHDGILVLDAATPVGVPLPSVMSTGATTLDVKITPNRGDWASLLGMAREVRAHFGGRLSLPPCEPPESGGPAQQDVDIRIEDRSGCHAYVARVVRGVRVGPSPEWLVRKLEDARREQLRYMAEIVEELYPSFRLFLYDQQRNYSIPYTVFGPLRAAIYVGEMYLVLNATEHIRSLTRHFDNLIRRAAVSANESAAFIGTLAVR